jgi:hypothetical protein
MIHKNKTPKWGWAGYYSLIKFKYGTCLHSNESAERKKERLPQRVRKVGGIPKNANY